VITAAETEKKAMASEEPELQIALALVVLPTPVLTHWFSGTVKVDAVPVHPVAEYCDTVAVVLVHEI
jgi:hypothetical protein